MTDEAPSNKLLDCVIEMARTLSLRIIAEGVETSRLELGVSQSPEYSSTAGLLFLEADALRRW